MPDIKLKNRQGVATIYNGVDVFAVPSADTEDFVPFYSEVTIDVGTTTTGEPGTQANVENVGTPTQAVFNFTIPRGRDGKDFQILGRYSTLAQLQAAHPTGQAGDAYAVGTAEDNTIYIWDVDDEEWKDIGRSQGTDGMKLMRRSKSYEAVKGTAETVTLTSASSSSGGSQTFQYASTVSVNQSTQVISLVNHSTTQSVNYTNYTRANSLNGAYFKDSNGNIYYGIANPTRAHPTGQPYTVSISAQPVTAELVYGEWELVDPSASQEGNWEYGIQQKNGDVTELTADALSEYMVSRSEYNPSAKTSEMTQEVGVDGNGKLWTSGGAGGDFLPLSGGTMTGNIAMGNHGITGLAAPTNSSDAATKAYVDAQILEAIGDDY